MVEYTLWEKEGATKIVWHEPEEKRTDAAVIIFPGGGYAMLCDYEGKDYAEYLNTLGITAFVVYYSIAPKKFPLPLLDARRAVRFVRANAEKFGVAADKIAVMGSSAGGHLAATVATYPVRSYPPIPLPLKEKGWTKSIITTFYPTRRFYAIP